MEKIEYNVSTGQVTVVQLTPEEEANALVNETAWVASQNTPEKIRLQAFNTVIQNDTVIQQLKTMTPTEFDTWWDTNITTAASAIALLKRILKLLLRQLR